MRKLLFALLVTLIFLSGCIYQEEVTKRINPLSISFSSDLKEVKSGEITFLYLIFDNLDEKEEYFVDAKIMNAGLFNIIETPESGELRGFQRKMLKWKLKAHDVPADTHTTVSAEAKISRTYSFHFPVWFVDSEYRRQEKISNRPIPKQSKTYTFSDHLVHVNIELNKAPPIDSLTVYGNVEIVPARSGIVDSVSISVDGNLCEMNEHQNAGFCTFSYTPKTIEEKRFEMEVSYEYKELGSVGFTIAGSDSAGTNSGGNSGGGGVAKCGSKCVRTSTCGWRKTSEGGISCDSGYCSGEKPEGMYVCRCDEIKCPN